MDEVCFRYPQRIEARHPVEHLRGLYHRRSHPRIAMRGEQAIVYPPYVVWAQRLVPELVLGLGGRLTPCGELAPITDHDPTLRIDARDG